MERGGSLPGSVAQLLYPAVVFHESTSPTETTEIGNVMFLFVNFKVG